MRKAMRTISSGSKEPSWSRRCQSRNTRSRIVDCDLGSLEPQGRFRIRSADLKRQGSISCYFSSALNLKRWNGSVKLGSHGNSSVAKVWWRRWESNPRPKLPIAESVHAFSRSLVSSRALGTDEETPETSLIDLILGAQAERVGPAYSATLATSP